MTTKPLTLTEIANRIHTHLKRFEADPLINQRDSTYGTRRFYYAGAHRAGNRVGVSYVSYQETAMLTREQALAYLSWLGAGNVGSHYAMQIKERS